MTTFALGQSVRLTMVFRDSAGVVTDPSSASLRIRKPTGDIDEYNYPETVERVSDGTYAAIITADRSGRWLAHAAGSGDDSTPSIFISFDVDYGAF